RTHTDTQPYTRTTHTTHTPHTHTFTHTDTHTYTYTTHTTHTPHTHTFTHTHSLIPSLMFLSLCAYECVCVCECVICMSQPRFCLRCFCVVFFSSVFVCL